MNMIKKTISFILLLFLAITTFGQILSESFDAVIPNEDFSKVGWTNFAEEGTRVFQGMYYESEDNYYVQMSAFNSGEESNVAWLVLPSVYITPGNLLRFRSKTGYSNADVFSLWVSTDFTGDVSAASWEELSFTEPTDDGTSYGNWQNSGAINLDYFAGSNICVAFKYSGGDPSATTTVQIDDILITQDPRVQVSPTSFYEEIEAGSMLNQTFTISNVGGGIVSWERSEKSFTKNDFADWNLQENQLRLTSNIWITRKDNQGIFNIAQETGFNNPSPMGTMWAYGLTHELSLDVYDSWADAISWNPPGQVGKEMSMNIIDTDIFFDVVFNSWTQGGNGGGFSLNYILAQAPWLLVNTQEGNISSNDSQVVDIVFDATDLVAGDYHSQIQFRTNDSENQIVSIPVTLLVSGEPNIVIDINSIDFGDVFVNGNQIFGLEIENNGADVLSVTSIASDEEAFSTNLSNFTIEPKTSRTIDVKFNPTAIASYGGLLTINSDDADEGVLTVSLTGNGVEAPEINIDPEFFDVSVTGCDIVEERTLTIANQGVANLEWSISDTLFFDNCEDNSQGWTTIANGPDDLWHLSTLNSYTLGSSWWCGIEGGNDYATGNRIENGLVSPQINLTGLNSAFISFWETYETEGGYDYCMVDVSIDGGASWIPLRGEGVAGESEGWNQVFIDLTPFCGEIINIRFYFDTRDNEFNNFSGWFIDDIFVGMNTNHFLSFSKNSGVIGQSESEEITITADATGLAGGTYSNVFALRTNDPLNFNKIVQFDYTVNTIPVIELSTDAIDFNNIVVFEQGDKQLVISNTGCEALEVTDITSTEAAFSVNVLTPFILQPNESIDITISFNPTDAIVYEGEIVITNSDEQKVVSLVGEGSAEPPSISVSEESFTVIAENCDEILYYTLTVFNTDGLSDLNYEIIDDQEGDIVVLSSGTVTPGNSADEIIEIDATGLDSGNYNYDLTINSNDPSYPTVVVSYTLTVNGTPEINLSATSIDFGEVGANELAVETFNLSNTGCKSLLVTGISSSLQEFQVSTAPFVIAPGENVDIEVTFAPKLAQTYEGTLTIINEFENQIINLAGAGVASSSAEISPESLSVSIVGCDVVQTEFLTISNIGGADLSWEILSNSILNGGFETGDYSPWELNPDHSAEVVTDDPASGNYCLKITGGTMDAFNGLSQTFEPTQTDYITVKIKPGTAPPHGVIAFGDETLVSSSPIVFQYFETGSTINMNGYTFPYTPGQWYHFEFKNISYAEQTFDYFINGELMVESATFEGTASHVSQIHLFNGFDETVYYDDVQVGGLPDWITLSNSTGTILPGSSFDSEIQINATGLNSGTYTAELSVSTNDPLNANIAVPVTLDILGDSEIILSDDALNFGDVVVGQSSVKNLVISNNGCHNLIVTNITSSETVFDVGSSGFTIAPNESFTLDVIFTPSELQSFEGLLTIANNDTEKVVILEGAGVGAPEMQISPESITLYTSDCNAQISDVFTISNSGSSNLNWAATSNLIVNGGFETGDIYPWELNPDHSAEVVTTDPASGNYCLKLTGGTGDVFNGLIQLFEPSPTDYVSVKIKPGTAPPHGVIAFGDETMETNSPVVFQFFETGTSINMNGNSFPYTPGQWYHFEYRNIDYTTQTFDYYINGMLMISDAPFQGPADYISQIQLFNGFEETVYYDDIQIGGLPDWITLSDFNGSVYPDGTSEVGVQIDATGLFSGVHTHNLIIHSNDPLQSDVLMPIALDISGSPEIMVSSQSIDFGQVITGSILTKSFTIFNNGCHILEVTNIESSNPLFSPQSTNLFIFPDESVEVQVTFTPDADGVHTADLTITNNDLEQSISLTGEALAVGTPIIHVSTNELNFGDVYLGQSSDLQQYSVSGINLTDNVEVNVPYGFQISTSSTSGFGNSLVLPQVAGELATTNIFVRFAPTAMSDYSEIISHTSVGATQKNVSVTGKGIAPPVINTSVQSLSFNDVYVDYESEEQSYTLSASGLSDDLIVTAPEGFVISNSADGDFTNTLTYTPANGIVPTSSVFVKFAPNMAMTYTGQIEHSSYSSNTKLVNVSGESLNTYSATFIVTDGTNVTSGAEVALAGYGTKTTDGSGAAIFEGVIPATDLTYAVTADGFDDYSGSVSIIDADVTEDVSLVQTSYTVSFSVVNQNDGPIEGAGIEIDNTYNLTTNAAGTAAIELVDNTYSFTISKDGYDDFSDSFTVNGEDLSIPVTIQPVGVETGLLSNVMVYPNPFTNSIIIDNASGVKQVVITSLIGEKIMEIELDGAKSSTLTTDKLVKGAYLITIESESGAVVVKKMVKQ